MGLDQYAYKVFGEPYDDPDKGLCYPEKIEIAYWRKHPDLQGWMQNLYAEKGGTEEFNCEKVWLEAEDLERLYEDVVNDNLPQTTGFFFGQSNPEEKEYDLEFIALALIALKQGYKVYYYSWW